MNIRRKFKADFKAKVVLESLKENTTIEALAKKYELAPNQISMWKSEAMKNFEVLFSGQKLLPEKDKIDVEKLYSQIGQLKVELRSNHEYLKKIKMNE